MSEWLLLVTSDFYLCCSSLFFGGILPSHRWWWAEWLVSWKWAWWSMWNYGGRSMVGTRRLYRTGERIAWSSLWKYLNWYFPSYVPLREERWVAIKQMQTVESLQYSRKMSVDCTKCWQDLEVTGLFPWTVSFLRYC